METNLGNLKDLLLKNLAELKNFNFSWDNLALWLILLVVFSVLSFWWNVKKAFTFCLVVAAGLLVSTQIEKLLVNTFGPDFDPLFVRLVSGFILVIIVLYYFCIKTE
jgi:hypothetical protein